MARRNALCVRTMLLQRLHDQLIYLDDRLKELDKELADQLAHDDLDNRLLSMLCVGPITASLSAVEAGNGPQYGCMQPRFCCLAVLGTQTV